MSNIMSVNNFKDIPSNKRFIIGVFSLALFIIVCLLCLLPETALAAGNLETQLTKAHELSKGKIKTIILTLATLGGGGIAIAKGNITLTITIIVAGIATAFCLAWIEGGMTVG